MEIEANEDFDITKKNVLFDDDVYMVEQNPDFIIRKPIRHGFFNVSEYNEDYTAIINDIENLIYYILT